ncbi:serine--tRNA ligase, mitochondrial isoform X1 [Lepeophtheirus salmonis]|uniref:serine--tRNA ligase, mitochondrial isoform X1 n=1 Tax=Lepeophtheirus salmonis TaxID=72036 RepID=UPI001AE68058|nr:serine--tRNA ligase, mitochondrial-like isoform X1 [Lepeophtheirus salmonis]
MSRLLRWSLSSGKLKFPEMSLESTIGSKEDVLRNAALREVGKDRIQQLENYFNEGKKSPLPRIPNDIHPAVMDLKEPKVIKTCLGERNTEKFKRRSFENIAEALGGVCRSKNLTSISGERAYYLLGPLAQLESALINYTVNRLTQEFGFKLISVPDILDPELILRCGFEVEGERNRVYKLSGRSKALSGTAEMALAAYFMNKTIKEKTKVASVSRCHRAEVSTTKSEAGGIYRVHNFTKVEMFGVCNSQESDALLQEFLDIEYSLFSDLGLIFQVLDMSPNELGDPATRKYDMEAYFPRQKNYGEISSCSNCTNYQSMRLNIRTEDGGYCHTVNGTACAVPRMIMAIVEQKQNKDRSVTIPEKLRPYFQNKSLISPNELNFPKFQYHESGNYFHSKE